MKVKPPHFINAGINTDSSITGYSKGRGRSAARHVRHLKIDNDEHFRSFYQVGELIGKGNFGTVFSVADTKDKVQWATKVIVKANLSPAHMQALEREMSILKMLDHPHIIMLREILESSAKFYLIFEKCNSDLLRFSNRKLVSETDVMRIMRDLASAVAYLHKKDIVHRDLKLENILITNNPNDAKDELYIKLSDFGLSIVKTGRDYRDMLHDRCGTLSYMAPEMLQNGSYSNLCDIWALGVIMYYLIANAMPFKSKRDVDLIELICTEEPNFNLPVTPECLDLVVKMLHKDPAKRLTAAEILYHPWMRGKSLTDSSESHNVIDMMRLWNKDLRLPTLENNETPILQSRNSKIDDKRRAVPMAVQNVKFDRPGSLRTQNRGNKGPQTSNTVDRGDSDRRLNSTSKHDKHDAS